jgi:hypothetical protein
VPFSLQDPDLDYISESLETVFWVKVLKFFDVDADPGSWNLFDPGFGMEKICIRDPGINIPDPQHCSIYFIYFVLILCVE